MIIDTHGHYDDEQFDVDREMLLTNLKERGLKAIVTVGASMQTSEMHLRWHISIRQFMRLSVSIRTRSAS